MLPENYNYMGKDEFIADILYVLSFNGFTKTEQDREREKLDEAVAETNRISVLPEEEQKYFIFMEDLYTESGADQFCTDDRTEPDIREEAYTLMKGFKRQFDELKRLAKLDILCDTETV